MHPAELWDYLWGKNKALGGGFIVTNLVVTLLSMTSLEQAFHWKTQGQGILHRMWPLLFNIIELLLFLIILNNNKTSSL